MIARTRDARHFGVADDLDMLAGNAIDEIHGGRTSPIESLVRIADKMLAIAAVVGVPTVMLPLNLFDLLSRDVGSP